MAAMLATRAPWPVDARRSRPTSGSATSPRRCARSPAATCARPRCWVACCGRGTPAPACAACWPATPRACRRRQAGVAARAPALRLLRDRPLLTASTSSSNGRASATTASVTSRRRPPTGTWPAPSPRRRVSRRSSTRCRSTCPIDQLQARPRRRLADADVRLSDGGLYDNLGLEPVWKTHRTVLVSDGGAVFGSATDGGLLARIGRYVDIVDHQALALRKRWLISNFLDRTMDGAYWGIGSATGNYPAGGPGYSKELGDAGDRQRAHRSRRVLAGGDGGAGEPRLRAGRRRRHAHLRALVAPDAPAATAPHPEWTDEEKVRVSLEKSWKRKLLGPLVARAPRAGTRARIRCLPICNAVVRGARGRARRPRGGDRERPPPAAQTPAARRSSRSPRAGPPETAAPRATSAGADSSRIGRASRTCAAACCFPPASNATDEIDVVAEDGRAG